MEFTVRLTDIFLLIITACACAVTFYAIALMRRLSAILADWRSTADKLDEVLTRAQRLCTTSEEAMQSVKGLADQGTLVVTNVVEVSDQIRNVAEEGLARLHGLMAVVNTASMLVSSFKAGLAAVRACRKNADENSKSDEDSSRETENE